MKDLTVNKTVWRKFLEDGTEVHEIQPTEADNYRKNKVQIYLQEAKRKVNGEPTLYVSIADYVPARRAGASLDKKLDNAIASLGDITSMTATELLAALKTR